MSIAVLKSSTVELSYVGKGKVAHVMNARLKLFSIPVRINYFKYFHLYIHFTLFSHTTKLHQTNLDQIIEISLNWLLKGVENIMAKDVIALSQFAKMFS